MRRPRHRRRMRHLRSGLGPSFPLSSFSQSLLVMSISSLCNHLLIALQATVGTRDQRACINQLCFRQRASLPQLRPATHLGFFVTASAPDKETSSLSLEQRVQAHSSLSISPFRTPTSSPLHLPTPYINQNGSPSASMGSGEYS